MVQKSEQLFNTDFVLEFFATEVTEKHRKESK